MNATKAPSSLIFSWARFANTRHFWTGSLRWRSACCSWSWRRRHSWWELWAGFMRVQRRSKAPRSHLQASMEMTILGFQWVMFWRYQRWNLNWKHVVGSDPQTFCVMLVGFKLADPKGRWSHSNHHAETPPQSARIIFEHTGYGEMNRNDKILAQKRLPSHGVS